MAIWETFLVVTEIIKKIKIYRSDKKMNMNNNSKKTLALIYKFFFTGK